MGFRIFVQATFPTTAVLGARAAREQANALVGAMLTRNEVVENTMIKVQNEGQLIRFRVEIDGKDLREPEVAKRDIQNLGLGIQKASGKLVTMRLSNENLMPPNEALLADQLTAQKNLTTVRTKQLAELKHKHDTVQTENADLRKRLGLEPRPPASGDGSSEAKAEAKDPG